MAVKAPSSTAAPVPDPSTGQPTPSLPSTPPESLSTSRSTSTRGSRVLEPALFAGRLGLLLMGAGLLIVGFGWYGISGRGGQINGVTDVRAQLPYLISGGFLGLSLVIMGAVLFLAQSQRQDRARDAAMLEVRFARLSAALGLPSEELADVRGLVVSGNAAYHSADCHLVGQQGQDYLTVDAAEAAGLRPCRICLG